MATEQFANNAQSSLTAALTAGATSFVVANAIPFPASGNFRALIDSEILLVTAVSGNTFTVTRGVEGTTAAAHVSGAYVTHVLTAGALLAWQAAAGGGVGTPVSKTSNYTAATGDLVLCDASGGAFTVTLPAASGNAGKTVAVKKTDSGGNAVTVQRAGGDTIRGLTSGGQTSFPVRGEGDAYWLVSDGTAAWHVVDRVISPSFCSVYQYGAQTITSGPDTAVLFDTEVSDADDLHSTSVNTSRITIKKAGKYLIVASVQWNALPATSRNLALSKNGVGTTKLSLLNTTDAYAGTGYVANTQIAQADLAAGDYVEASVFQTSGSNQLLYTVSQATALQAQRVGD